MVGAAVDALGEVAQLGEAQVAEKVQGLEEAAPVLKGRVAEEPLEEALEGHQLLPQQRLAML